MPRLSAFAVAITVLSSAAARAQEPGDPRAGLVLAQRNCAECHDVNSRDLNTSRSGVMSFYAAANKPGMSRLALLVWMQTSHPTMPNLILDPDDMADVVAYIVSLKSE